MLNKAITDQKMFTIKGDRSKRYLIFILVCFYLTNAAGQQQDSLSKNRFSIHAQTTVITQFKPAFHAKYSGPNSLSDQTETRRSITTTLFLGTHLWRGAGVFINPEIGGGSGLSGSAGVGASTNGETYRIGNPAPQFELARLFFSQIIDLNRGEKYSGSDINKLAGIVPTRYFSLTLGKICVADIFDYNRYSHDPRTQFMSWALMNNGAWDFPANTRGYTPSLILEYVTPQHQIRYGFSLVSSLPNGMQMNWRINKASSQTLEYTYNYNIAGRAGALRLLSYFTTTDLGNYALSLSLNPSAPVINDTQMYGRTKYGFGINCEQELSYDLGFFVRAGWNDGKNETWEFTEIDRSLSCGLVLDGNKWHRQNDKLGLATVVSGLSVPHRRYLQNGGLGFELGDGNLSYALESLVELYYSFCIVKDIFVSGAYQFLNNPGYNKDRGPVNVFSVRVHLEI
jgi:high affinity Mn2+ porin